MEKNINNEPGFIVILTTCSDMESAQRIATCLIDKKLAACVQIDQPIMSVYRWDNQVETSQEYRLVIKTASQSEGLVYEAIQELHSYDVPQLVTIPITNGSESYLNWIIGETKKDG